jgi:hypothetical protein
MRIDSTGANTVETIALAYTSTANLIVLMSCVLLLAIIPIALKFFRGKEELRNK